MRGESVLCHSVVHKILVASLVVVEVVAGIVCCSRLIIMVIRTKLQLWKGHLFFPKNLSLQDRGEGRAFKHTRSWINMVLVLN
jgi:hypothetical protein